MRATVLLVLLSLTSACSESPSLEGANVVVVVIDTLRRDRVHAPPHKIRLAKRLRRLE